MNKLKTAYKNSGSKRSPRHAFLFQIPGQKPAKVWTKVKPAKQQVKIILTELDVRTALDNQGQGDAQNCAGAVCAKRHGENFPHKTSGHFDFLYRSFYVADANDKLGLPKSCVAYAHDSKIAQLFDSRDGLKKPCLSG